MRTQAFCAAPDPRSHRIVVWGLRINRDIEGKDRFQSVLFPERLDESIGDDNPVRLVEALEAG